MSEFTSSPVREGALALATDDENTVVGLRQVIYNLRHQLSNLKTEHKVLQASNDSITSRYEDVIKEKNSKIHKLQDDFDFLYKEREALKSLNSNSSQVNDEKVKQLESQNAELASQNLTLQEQLDEVDESVYKLNLKYQKTKTDLEYYADVNEQLEERLSSLENDNNQLLKYNDELIKKLEDFAQNSKSSDMLKFNENLHLKNISLQRTNNQLQLKLDKLLQNKTSNELLRQKNLSLMNKLRDHDELKERISKLEIEKIELQNKYQGYIKLAESNPEEKSFLESYNHLKNINLVLEEELASCKAERNEYKASLVEIEHQLNNELLPTIEKLAQDNQAKDTVIEKLQNQYQLNLKEIEFLRALLSKLEKIQLQNLKEVVQKSTDEYLTNLEKLVDGYKKENASLQEKLNSRTKTNIPGLKRQRVDDAYRRRSEIDLSTIQTENTQLKAKIKDLNYQVDLLKSQIDNMTLIDSKKKQLHILQMKSNPFTSDQLVKQSMLDALRKENNDLVEKFVNNNEEVILIPRSVFERQELDYSLLQEKFDDLLKRSSRLKESFTKKARDILTNISKFFGFTIEFLEGTVNPTDVGTKIKLTSKYTNTPELKNSYIILDLPKKSLKAYGNSEFKGFCSELVSEWANDKDQVSCILSALNIKLYQKYVLNV